MVRKQQRPEQLQPLSGQPISAMEPRWGAVGIFPHYDQWPMVKLLPFAPFHPSLGVSQFSFNVLSCFAIAHSGSISLTSFCAVLTHPAPVTIKATSKAEFIVFILLYNPCISFLMLNNELQIQRF